MNRRTDAAARFAERRRLEDEAPRLREVVPNLVTCRLTIEEGRGDMTTALVTHARHVVVDRAAALFLLPCGDAACRDGGHDITHELLRGLRAGQEEVRGEDTCSGRTGTADCGRTLRFVATATYKDPA